MRQLDPKIRKDSKYYIYSPGKTARDLFLYRTVTSRKIERESRGGGGSSTHRTSDGGRAGGRGGSF